MGQFLHGTRFFMEYRYGSDILCVLINSLGSWPNSMTKDNKKQSQTREKQTTVRCFRCLLFSFCMYFRDSGNHRSLTIFMFLGAVCLCVLGAVGISCGGRPACPLPRFLGRTAALPSHTRNSPPPQCLHAEPHPHPIAPPPPPCP